MRPDGIRSAARALRYWERRQEAVSHNLANVSTPGFKGERIFARLIENGDSEVLGQTDWSPGAISPTGRDLDIAVDGDGFLVVETEVGERYTRSGAFTMDETGALVTTQGHLVLGEQGPIVLPPGRVEISANGEISVDGALVGRLRLERPADPGALQREGGSLFVPPATRESISGEPVSVRQGHLENSNIDPVSALVEMIEVERAYSAIQRTLQVADAIMGTISNELGRVQ